MMANGVRNVFRLAAVLMAGMACGQTIQSNEPQLNDDLAAKITFGLCWISYWEPDYVINYKAGETIPIKLVQSPDELVVLLSRIRLSITFHRSSDGKLDHLAFVGGLSRIGNERLDSDVQFYIQSHKTNGTPGFRLKPSAESGPDGFAVPTERVIGGNPLTPASFRVSNASFRLPDLAPPKYISERIKPQVSMVDSLRSAVIKAVQSHMKLNSKPATVVIPYFSPEDPAINVFVDFHETDFSEGIFWVTPDALEGWSLGKLILNPGARTLGSHYRQGSCAESGGI